MNSWTFYDFLDTRGVNLIQGWPEGLPDKARAKIDARILFMKAMATWPEQYVSALTGWYRPLGFYGPQRRQFTIVLGTIEKGKLPRRVLEKKADEHRKIILADPSRIREHNFGEGSGDERP